MPSAFVDSTICIVGLGLMGGSLAAALSQSGCRHVTGVARREETVQRAQALGYIASGTLDLAEGVKQADLVILATPVRQIIEQIAQLGTMCRPGTLIMDLGSSKQQVCSALDRLPPQIQAIGGHPMCGKSRSGLEEADPELYRNHVFVLCPLERTTRTSLERCFELIDVIGARPLLLDAARHDRLVAVTSHMPYLAAAGLVNAADEFGRSDALVWEVAASGFRDTTRLAESDVTMMLDILLTNRQAVLEEISRTTSQLDLLAHALASDDQQALAALLTKARNRRKEL